eukprot:9204655-Pyramimonas_sp.AAC.1
MSKCDEEVPHYLLAQSGVKHGFRARRLRFLLALYRGRRSLQFDMRVSAETSVEQGVLTGCS